MDTLNPKEVNENAYTIKREVTDYTRRLKSWRKKLASINTTLTESLATYDALIVKATAQGDVSSLAQLTDSKLNLIERLTMSQIDINAQLERKIDPRLRLLIAWSIPSLMSVFTKISLLTVKKSVIHGQQPLKNCSETLIILLKRSVLVLLLSCS